MLKVETTGFDDLLDGSANIRVLVIGGPGVGKTRWSSFWPKPLLIDCEGNRGSLIDRAMPFVRVTSSKEMLDVLEYAKAMQSTPKAQRKYQTLVIDTADSFQRIVKEEWVTDTKAAAFTGFDAWGYLDTKMQLLFTRLLNLDFNVVVLVHYKSKEHKDGDNTVREFVLQLQGAISDQIFNDFGLVGWMGTYWEAGENGRVQKRGLTFTPTPEKPFLKDTFNITPAWMPVGLLDESDYNSLMDLFMARVEGQDIPDRVTVDEIPPANTTGPVKEPFEGGALAERPPVPAAEVPLEKKLVGELKEIADGLGVTYKGNTLKSELVSSIRAAQLAAAVVESSRPPSTPPSTTDDAPDPWAPSSTVTETASPGSTTSAPVETPPASQPADAPPPAASDSAEALIASELGGEVIPEPPADAPDASQSATPSTPVETPSAPQGPSACADCGADLKAAWADPAGKNQLRKSFIRHKKYLCWNCANPASN